VPVMRTVFIAWELRIEKVRHWFFRVPGVTLGAYPGLF
jgi:hypothetical protein